MVLLLSFFGEWVVAAVIVAVAVGFVGLLSVSSDIEEKPWKYRDWLDADEARKKARQAKKSSHL